MLKLFTMGLIRSARKNGLYRGFLFCSHSFKLHSFCMTFFLIGSNIFCLLKVRFPWSDWCDCHWAKDAPLSLWLYKLCCFELLPFLLLVRHSLSWHGLLLLKQNFAVKEIVAVLLLLWLVPRAVGYDCS